MKNESLHRKNEILWAYVQRISESDKLIKDILDNLFKLLIEYRKENSALKELNTEYIKEIFNLEAEIGRLKGDENG